MKHTILYVDDEEISLKYFERLLQGEYNIITANNSMDAKNILDQENEKISLLLTDQRMPVEKGNILLEYSRTRYPAITRILTTAYQDIGDAIESVNNGEILRYITKPWNLEELKLEIQNGIRFYELRKERDLLIREKLGTSEQGYLLNITRDLLLISSNINIVNNTTHALNQFFQDTSFVEYAQELKTNCHWNEAINSTIQLRAIAVELQQLLEKQISANAGNTFANEINTLLDEAKCHIEFTLEAAKEIHEIPDILHEPVKSLIRYIDQKTTHAMISITQTDGVNKISASADIDKSNSAIEKILLNKLFLYLSTFHYAGNISCLENDKLQFNISIPNEPDNKSLPQLNDHWLELLLEKYQNW